MTENTDSTIEVEHNGETIDVPTTFERSDLAAFFGGVPDSIDVDRVYILDENVRAESYQGDGEWIEVVYQTKECHPVDNASELGWVAEVLEGGAHGAFAPGETVWERVD